MLVVFSINHWWHTHVHDRTSKFTGHVLDKIFKPMIWFKDPSGEKTFLRFYQGCSNPTNPDESDKFKRIQCAQIRNRIRLDERPDSFGFGWNGIWIRLDSTGAAIGFGWIRIKWHPDGHPDSTRFGRIRLDSAGFGRIRLDSDSDSDSFGRYWIRIRLDSNSPGFHPLFRSIFSLGAVPHSPPHYGKRQQFALSESFFSWEQPADLLLGENFCVHPVTAKSTADWLRIDPQSVQQHIHMEVDKSVKKSSVLAFECIVASRWLYICLMHHAWCMKCDTSYMESDACEDDCCPVLCTMTFGIPMPYQSYERW